MHPEVPIFFSLTTGPDYTIYYVVMRELSVLCTMSLQPKPVPIYTPGSR